LELQLNDGAGVQGRISGAVPSQGELTPEIVEDLMLDLVGKKRVPRAQPDLKPRRPSLCAGCPHRPAFYLARRIFPDAVYTGDIGCYTLGVNMGAVDTCLCMGASVGLAGGFSRVDGPGAKGKVVAAIGDSTFYHSGAPALINAVHTMARFVLIIMDNGTTAMTGGQPTPAVEGLAGGAKGRAVNMETLVRGCGVEFVEVVDPYDYEALERAYQEANKHTFEQEMGVSVIITRRACIRMAGIAPTTKSLMITEDCDLCMSCVKDLECPAFEYVKGEKRMVINSDLCAGCGVCVHTCPSGAVVSTDS
jgi:indolepyruvate ferredoxin oxidoreductase alpha subunit